MNWQRSDVEKYVTFKTSRSGGKGGQNVNKVSTKAELNIDIKFANLFTEQQQNILFKKLAARINKNGILQVISEEERSQLLNKEVCFKKLLVLINKAFYVNKKRKPTKPTKSSIEKRLKGKMAQSRKKISRKPNLEFF